MQGEQLLKWGDHSASLDKKKNTMQRAMRTVLESPKIHATSKHFKYNK